MKIVNFAVLILMCFSISCSTQQLSYVEPKRPDNIPKMAKWSENKWMYLEEKGTYTFWYANGQKAQQGKLINRKKEDLCTTWYENGIKEQEGMFKNDLAEGLWYTWYPNGKLMMKGYFLHDKEDGLWEGYDENGKKVGEKIYKNGEMISEKYFPKK